MLKCLNLNYCVDSFYVYMTFKLLLLGEFSHLKVWDPEFELISIYL